MSLSLPEFVARWKASKLTERAAAQSHFIDLCDVLRQPHPAAADQTGDTFTFEKHVSTLAGGKGFADVWKRNFFAWEYKGKHKDLLAAYRQLADYREDLENPPLLVVCDQDRFEVHTNFERTRPQVYRFTLDDLLAGVPTPHCLIPPLEVLRAVFINPELLRPEAAQARVTEHAAEEFAKLANSLEQRGAHPERAAHFLMRLLFCLFADSIGLLPEHLFRQMIELDKARPANFTRKLRQLFAAMAASGSSFGPHDIHYFNGGLFADDEVFELSAGDMAVLSAAAALDWAQVEPAIFGTLFERSLNPGKRSQLGAHYTSREDILLIVEPVVIEPLRRRWEAVKAEATALAEAAEKEAAAEATAKKKGSAYPKLREQLQNTLLNWVEELSAVRILDPACGSGNFLYLALRRMLDLWHEVRLFSAQHGLPTFLEKQVHPSQLYGLETNVYAQELASVVVWIGYLQWLNQNAIGWPTEPILRKLDNIQNRDAILAHDADGKPVVPPWPDAEFIIGNPPFLGDKRMRAELGDKYVEELRSVYAGRIPAMSDLVCYWFEQARKLLAEGRVKRVGLLATQGIRGGANRNVLQRINETGSIFWAQSDRNWYLEGAMVHVSMIAFDNGTEAEIVLDGRKVVEISAALTSGADLTNLMRLPENEGIAFIGDMKKGKFDIVSAVAKGLLELPMNPNGRPNTDVVRQFANASDLTKRGRNKYIIDFDEMPEGEAALYEAPFEYLRRHVKPSKEKVRNPLERARWWQHGRVAAEMRAALRSLSRYIATPRHSKHRLFVWLPLEVVPDSALVVFTRDDDYFLGVLQSKVHERWARSTGTQVRDAESGFRYTPQVCFDPYPFPWPPGHEPNGNPQMAAIAAAARELVEKRDAWLNPPGATEAELKKRTLTNLYNARPTWLAEVHRRLDIAVLSAYGWPLEITDEEILSRLLALNHERAGSSPQQPKRG